MKSLPSSVLALIAVALLGRPAEAGDVRLGPMGGVSVGSWSSSVDAAIVASAWPPRSEACIPIPIPNRSTELPERDEPRRRCVG